MEARFPGHGSRAACMLKLSLVHDDCPQPSLSDLIGPAVEIWRTPEGEISAYGYTDNGQHWVHFPGLASFCFCKETEEVQAIPHRSVQYDMVYDVYLRSVVPLALQVHGTEVLHASAIHTSRGVVVFCAVSGTGKSTLAYGFSQKGYRVWADDAVAFAATREWVTAVPLPATIRLRPDVAIFFRDAHLNMSSRLAPAPTTQEQEEPQPLLALCLLDRTQEGHRKNGAAVEIVRVSSAQAFPRVLAHAYCFSLLDTRRKQRMVQQYLDLVAQVPTYIVRFRAGLEHLAAIMNGLERTLETIGRN